jgi:hypothetical protein
VTPGDTGSRIEVVSDIDLSGRIASLGRGIRDVSNQMFVQFANQLGTRIEHPGQVVHAPKAPSPTFATVHKQPPDDQLTTSEIKVLRLLWTVTRTRFADFLERLSLRVRPR